MLWENKNKKRFSTEHQTQLKLRDVPALFSEKTERQQKEKHTEVEERKQRRYKYNCIITTTTIEKT